ncbi:MAG: serine/threonine-protein kinase [Kofleriaceae bacterium]
MSERPGEPPRDPSLAQTAQVEAIVDRRLSDSNQTWLGKIVDGRYRVLEVIGRGGMGVVYRVEHLRMGKIAAMKVLHRDLAADADIVQRFEREAHAVSRLNNPHTVQVFDFGQFQNNLYLIMELVRGLDLGRVVTRDGPIAWARAAPMFVQICNALQEAHELGIVHRDLKPENVLVTRTTGGRDFAKVLDFGLAKLDGRTGPVDATDRNAIVGTPYFMAPEQIRGEDVDARTDIYSLGALMFQVLTGTYLYTSATAVGVLTKHLTGDPDAPSMRTPRMGIPPAVDHVVRKALARDPRERWQTAAELCQAIEDVYAETVTEATPHRSGRHVTRSSRFALDDEDEDLHLRRSDIDQFERGLKRRRVFVGVLTTLSLLGAAAGAFWLVTRTPPPATSDREPNDEPEDATRIAANSDVTGFLGKRRTTSDPDRDIYVIKYPSGSRRTLSVTVTAPPNIDINLSVHDGAGTHSATADEGGMGEGETLHRRSVDGPVTIVVAQTMAKDQKFPTENVSDPYTLRAVEETAPGELEPNNTDADATPLVLTQELRGYLDTRLDTDVLRWDGADGQYTVIVRADGLPMAWRLSDGKARTPGGATVTLRRGEMLRFERTDRAAKGSLVGRDARWSIVVTQ